MLSSAPSHRAKTAIKCCALFLTDSWSPLKVHAVACITHNPVNWLVNRVVIYLCIICVSSMNHHDPGC
jgi:hypothetical protein